MQHKIKLKTPIHGFAATNARAGEKTFLISRGRFTSDDLAFHKYIETFSNTFLPSDGPSADGVTQFLAIIHEDLNADVYINNFNVIVEILSKRDVESGELVRKSDIGDIGKVIFPDIEIKETDKVVYVFKVGWRFGMFFDFAPPQTEDPAKEGVLDLEAMFKSIGDLRRYLTFYNVFETLSAQDQYEKMQNDGWFPFIEVISSDYQKISDLYVNRFNFDERLKEILSKFDHNRIDKITKNWWRNPIYESKRQIIEAGINAFLRNDKEGFINCIKTLNTEVEGILRQLYFRETGKGQNVKSKDLISYIVEKGKTKASSAESMLLPEPFLEYLEKIIFANFNIETGVAPLSRNSASHGVADESLYTKERALQMILILDQIRFYL